MKKDCKQFRILLSLVVLMMFVMASLIGYRTLTARASTSQPMQVITPATLEEQYGLRINLAALTAAGGMVDLRFKILDAAKARQLISDSKHLPTLVAARNGKQLVATEDSQSQALQLENDGNLFLLYSNSANAVKPGAKIAVQFGDVSIDSITVR